MPNIIPIAASDSSLIPSLSYSDAPRPGWTGPLF
jgi:hypothetical protein